MATCGPACRAHDGAGCCRAAAAAPCCCEICCTWLPDPFMLTPQGAALAPAESCGFWLPAPGCDAMRGLTAKEAAAICGCELAAVEHSLRFREIRRSLAHVICAACTHSNQSGPARNGHSQASCTFLIASFANTGCRRSKRTFRKPAAYLIPVFEQHALDVRLLVWPRRHVLAQKVHKPLHQMVILCRHLQTLPGFRPSFSPANNFTGYACISPRRPLCSCVILAL